jgi:hypothetical protein
MKHLKFFSEIILEDVQSYEFELVSDNPMLVKYSFIDAVGNNYLVEFKNKPVGRVGDLSNIYELVYFVKDDDYYSVSKIVNVNPYRVLKTVFTDILNDFKKRVSWTKKIYFIGLSKDIEKDYISSRTKIYKRYLDMNPPSGFRVSQNGNTIELNKI